MNSHPNYHSFFNKLDIPRKFHIWEFPRKLWIRLDPRIMKTLVNQAVENLGSIKQVANALEIHVNQFYYYHVSKIAIPFLLLIKLCQFTGDTFTIENLEPYVVAYKSGPNAKPIRNPKLPIQESPNLFALIGHLIGDGGYSRSLAYYSNTSGSLIVEFLSLLRVVFGDVPVYVMVKSQKKSVNDIIIVQFGLTIIRILRHIYQTDFRTFSARVPQRLFELPREYAAAFLRAFGDDEGCVQDNRITGCSANKKLIQDINRLVKTKFPELGNSMYIYEGKKGPKRKYEIRFCPRAFTNYRNLIGFTHPKKKQALERILTRRARGWRQRSEGETRRMLLEYLQIAPMTVKELAKRLDIVVCVTRNHLNGLIGLDYVRVNGNGLRGAKVYEITEQGFKILSLPRIGLLQSGRAVKRKLNILKLLLTRGAMTAKQLGNNLEVSHLTIRSHLDGRSDCGYQGLVELELVRRICRGGRFTPDVYKLTREGKKLIKEVEPLKLSL